MGRMCYGRMTKLADMQRGHGKYGSFREVDILIHLCVRRCPALDELAP